VGQSVSRLFLALATAEQKTAAAFIRDCLTTYQKNEDLISVGAYAPGNNPQLDKAVLLKPQLDAFLKQGVDDRFSYDECLALLTQLLD
jgi:flagellum-specific ATP synthase